MCDSQPRGGATERAQERQLDVRLPEGLSENEPGCGAGRACTSQSGGPGFGAKTNLARPRRPRSPATRSDDEHGVPVFPGQSLLQPPPPLPTPLPSPRAWQGPGEGETPAGGMALAASGQQRSFRGQFRTPSAVRGAVLMATGLQTLLGLFALGGPGNGAGRSAWPVRDSATCHPRHCGHGGGDTPRTRGCTWASARSSDGGLLPGADGV